MWALAVIAAMSGLTQLTLVLRIAGTILVVGAWAMIFKHGPRRLFLSPLTHFAAFALLFYGWFPLLSLLMMDINLDGDLYSTRDNYGFIADYVGSPSELAIIGLAGLSLAAFAVTAMVLAVDRDPGVDRVQLPPALGRAATLGILALILVLLVSIIPQFGFVTETPLGREFTRAGPVLFSFLAAVLVATLQIERRWQFAFSVVILVAGLFVLTMIHRAQMPLLIAYALGLLVTVSVVRNPRQLIWVMLPCVVFLSAIMVGLVVLRPAHDTMSPISDTHRVLIMAEQKLLHRQGVSAACFNR